MKSWDYEPRPYQQKLDLALNHDKNKHSSLIRTKINSPTALTPFDSTRESSAISAELSLPAETAQLLGRGFNDIF
jgi:hypothetical protein